MTLLDEVLQIQNLSVACAETLKAVIKNESKRYAKEFLYKKAREVRKINKQKSLLDLMGGEIRGLMGELKKKIKEEGYSRTPLHLHREPKPSGGTRILMIHSLLREKIIERAVYQIIGPILRKSLDNGVSFCGIPIDKKSKRKLGVFAAHQAICNVIQASKWWILKADIEKFFDRLQRERVLALLKTNLKDDSLDNFFVNWTNIQVSNPEDDYDNSELGIPQGSCLSGLISNLYLLDFDENYKGKNINCFRYADDLFFACKTKHEISQLEENISNFLQGIGLQTKKSKTERYKPGEKFGILGYEYENQRINIPEEKISRWILSIGLDFKKISRIVRRIKKKKISKRDIDRLVVLQKKILQKMRSYSSSAAPYLQLPENINRKILHKHAFARIIPFLSSSTKSINRIYDGKFIKIVRFTDRKGKTLWPYSCPQIQVIREYL